MSSEEQEALVQRWHRAVNAQDLERAGELVTNDVFVGGPRGTGNGRQEFLDWVNRAGIQLTPVSWHHVDDQTVVVAQEAAWPEQPETGTGHTAVETATLFRLRDDKVSEIRRFNELDEALAAVES